MTIQDITYKTFEIPTDVEHQATPINLSGATTIKLTQVPASVKCWISTESTGYNLFPLINRGDGWVNLPKPLYDVYVYTKGTTEDNQKVIISYTGQSDFLEYGSSAAEKIEQVGEVQNIRNLQSVDNVDNVTSVDTVDNVKQVQAVKNVEVTSLLNAISDAVVKSINKAIYNTYTNKVVARFLIQGEWEFRNVGVDDRRFCVLPLGRDTNIPSLKLSDTKFYRITQIGHFDTGNALLSFDSSHQQRYISITSHFSIFKNTAGATFTTPTPSSTFSFNFDNFFEIDKAPYATPKDEFNLWGGKYYTCERSGWDWTETGYSGNLFSTGFNFYPNDFIISGKILNSYEKFGIFWKIRNAYSNEYRVNATPSCHCSLLLEISEVIS